jgi:hypothetical protein
MPTFDLEPLLAPLDAPSPTGDNLEYQPDFLALEELAQTVHEARAACLTRLAATCCAR